MSIRPGDVFAHYRIGEPLGKGGMGEVFVAEDLKLGRRVAVKTLASEFRDDPERLARFEREARALAALNHGRIAQIYGLEEVDGHHLLVMELVAGRDLATRLAEGSMAVREAIAVARQIAEALDAAHERGIVHRDLKPANVMLGADGKAKVLDFGLAKSTSAVVDESAATGDDLSSVGLVVGTAPYMSPEQAKGAAVDKRSDIWAFGCVLYEMLAGHSAFGAGSPAETISRVITAEPEWARLPGDTPGVVGRLLKRCLAKDRTERLRDIGDALLELRELPEDSLAPPVAPDSARRAGALRLAVVGALCVVAGWLLAQVVSPGYRPAAAPPPRHARIVLPSETELSGFAGKSLAISPDGRHIAFVATGGDESSDTSAAQDLYLQDLSTGQVTRVPDSRTAESPFFSPDGRWVGFGTGVTGASAGVVAGLHKAPVAGGPTQLVTPITDLFGASWGTDGSIVFAQILGGGLWSVSAEGGTPSLVVGPAEGQHLALMWPRHLPEGDAVLASLYQGPGGRLVVVDLETGGIEELGIDGTTAEYSTTGELLFARTDGTLSVVDFELRSRSPRGLPVKLTEELSISGAGAGLHALSSSGSLVFSTGYLGGSARTLARIVEVDHDGDVQLVAGLGDDVYSDLSLSPAGDRLAIAYYDSGIWIYDLERRTRLNLPQPDFFGSVNVLWDPDGEHVVHSAFRDRLALYRRKADGSTPPQRLTTTGDDWAGSWVPGTRSLLYHGLSGRGGDYDIWSLDMESGAAPTHLLGGAGQQAQPAVSPDGRWLAYTSSETGAGEVMVVRYPELDRRTVVSTAGGAHPRWSRDGRTLWYLARPRIMAVEVPAGDAFRPGTPRVAFELPGVLDYEVAPEGRMLAVQLVPGANHQTEIGLVLGWGAASGESRALR